MKHQRLAALLVILAAACTPPQQAETPAGDAAPTAVASACSGYSSRDWSAVGSAYYLIEAEAQGPTCADAFATMRIKSRDGVTLFERAYPVASVPLAFNPNGDQSTLRADLEAWTSNTADPATAYSLPHWPAGARKPPGFTPVVTRNQYEGARGAQGPLFCFPDGGESNACVAMDGSRATLLGSLTPERD